MQAHRRPAVLSALLLLGAAMAWPASRARAQEAPDPALRARVDISEVVFRDGVPYVRDGRFRGPQRLLLLHDRYGRAAYFRAGPVQRAVAPAASRIVACDRRGRCAPAGEPGRPPAGTVPGR